jgi:hypothetical protein
MRSRSDISREEFDRLQGEHADQIEELRRQLETQFTRIAQLQAELDRLKKNGL